MKLKNLEVKQLNHLGMVAGICEEAELVDLINGCIGVQEKKVSVGEGVLAMILNALGFSNRALYLTPDYLKHKPVDVLINKDLVASDFNDDSLGRSLDKLYAAGITEVFYKIAHGVCQKFNISHKYVHLDSTTFSFHGENYRSKDEECPVKVTRGFSKDNHPELNQVVCNLICSYKSTLPLWLEVLSGNTSDKTSFKKSIYSFANAIKSGNKNLPVFVADSALYSETNIKSLSEVQWITRVPEVINDAKRFVDTADRRHMYKCDSSGYWYEEQSSNYGGIDQTWFVFYSEKAFLREQKTFEKNLNKAEIKYDKELLHLKNIKFNCHDDAVSAVKKIIKKWKHHSLQYDIKTKQMFGKSGRPKLAQTPSSIYYFVKGVIVKNKSEITKSLSRKGKFIIATNQDREKITPEEILNIYKNQGVSVERGFRFLKDPIFYAESLYLKKPERIMSLIMVMTLSLLVYSIAEMELKKRLELQGIEVKNSVGKLVLSLTFRRVLQMFQDIVLVIHDANERQVMNLEKDHETILKALGPVVKKYYFLN